MEENTDDMKLVHELLIIIHQRSMMFIFTFNLFSIYFYAE